jgi:MFS family permease
LNSSTAAEHRLGPIVLAPGYLPRNAVSYLFASFVTVGLFAFISLINPYILTTNVGVPSALQGSALGTLGVVNELLSLLLVAPMGALADKIGRSFVYATGFLWLAAGFFLYPLARTFPQLLAASLFLSVGVTAVGCMLATVLADTPREDSRGKLVGFAGLCQGLGVVAFIFALGRLPQRLSASGMDALTAGRVTLGVVSVVCLLTAAVCWFGLRRGTPSTFGERETLLQVLKSGLAVARGNPRIWFAYGLQFVSFADRIVIGTFFSLRLQQAGIAQGLSPGDALAAASRPALIANASGVVFALVFGLLLDRVNRITAGAIAMAIACIGYLAGGFIGDPTSPWIAPVAILLGLGQICSIVASQTVLGQEAPKEVRGAVFGFAGICASLGILLTNGLGGWLYDAVGKGSPFFLIAAVNLAIMIFGIALLRRR